MISWMLEASGPAAAGAAPEGLLIAASAAKLSPTTRAEHWFIRRLLLREADARL
jgi:hypothetical protein